MIGALILMAIVIGVVWFAVRMGRDGETHGKAGGWGGYGGGF